MQRAKTLVISEKREVSDLTLMSQMLTNTKHALPRECLRV